jgi:hypothetical protein
VWAALSRDGRDANSISASLALVSGDRTTTNQTTQTLGTFSGPGTGGWGRNMLFPMKNTQGAIATVKMGGEQTVRFYDSGGDFDYFFFVPTAAPVEPPMITGATLAGGTITVTWTGGGTLESAASLAGPWTATGDSDGSYSKTVTAGSEFFRVNR